MYLYNYDFLMLFISCYNAKLTINSLNFNFNKLTTEYDFAYFCFVLNNCLNICYQN